MKTELNTYELTRDEIDEIYNFISEGRFKGEYEKEIAYHLCRDYKDPYIYIPKELIEIVNFFGNRIGKITQLGTGVHDNGNLNQTRQEHCIDTAFCKKIRVIHKFLAKKENKDYVISKNLQIYLLAELIKSYFHDIGHLPLSHCMEKGLGGRKGFHEEIGREFSKLPEVRKMLNKIDPRLFSSLQTVYNEDLFGFKILDEGTMDIDQISFMQIDSLYLGDKDVVKMYDTLALTRVSTNSRWEICKCMESTRSRLTRRMHETKSRNKL